MKKRVVFMILLLMAVTVLNARKNIKFFWSCGPQVPQTIRQNILNDIKSSVISSERFLISNEEEIQEIAFEKKVESFFTCLLYTSPSPRDRTRSRMPSSA